MGAAAVVGMPSAAEAMPCLDSAMHNAQVAQDKAAAKAAKSAAKAAELERTLADVIRRDSELYGRLLLFEPVELREIRDRVVAVEPQLQGLGEERLRQFLDA